MSRLRKSRLNVRNSRRRKNLRKIEPEKVVPETRATVKFTAPVIKDDKDVKEEMPPMVKMNKETKESVLRTRKVGRSY